MDTSKFNSAQQSYEQGDYPKALQGFLEFAKDTGALEPGDRGYLYHMMGNCLVKMKRYDKAIPTYKRALEDTEYPRHAALNVNLGIAYSSSNLYEKAVECFQAALDDDSYSTPYKAYTAMGSALLKLRRPADAGVVYRKAALEENNPDPARSLVNLGVCFMALNRPHDAVESYVTALEFDTTAEARNKTYANLGQAYVATGRMQEAVESFEHALEDGSYQLSASAQTDYDRARTNVQIEENPAAGLDTYDTAMGAIQPLDEETSVIPSPDDTGFFTVNEEELVEQGKQEVREERKRRGRGFKITMFLVILLAMLGTAASLAYTKGYGYPTQEQVVTDLFVANASGQDVSQYWITADADAISKEMAGVGASDNITIDAVERGPIESFAYVTEKLPEGGEVRYKIALVRNLASWKVADIELDFPTYSNK